MSTPSDPVAATERVLPTLNVDGTRRWIRPRTSPGRYWRARRASAYVLMAVFFLLPYLPVGGKPAVLLDLPRREFTIFGVTFLSTETLLFMLLMFGCILLIFAFTAVFGRVWCGWACPQTVYMEYLFRPIEQWLEGGRIGSLYLDERRGPHRVRAIKYAIYLALALFLAHTFLAYFVGVEQLRVWVTRSPIEHPTSFFVMLGTTAMIFLNFAWFREQTCLVACPYGRLQSVLLDKRSLIVAYDSTRGEPRMKGIKNRPAVAGDCIDCRMCVITCPTGIDIRQGLQMECVHCTQCINACDAVMDRIKKPRGLIGYASRDGRRGLKVRLLRPRTLVYAAGIALVSSLFVFNLETRANTEVTLLRGAGAPFTRAADGSVTNLVRIRISNRGGEPRSYRIVLVGAGQARLVAPLNPFPVAAGRMGETSVFVVLEEGAFRDRELPVAFHIEDDRGVSGQYPYRLLGPESEDHEGDDEEGE